MLRVFILRVVMLNAVMLNVVMLNVVMLSVVAPLPLIMGKRNLLKSFNFHLSLFQWRHHTQRNNAQDNATNDGELNATQ